jgi:hypothetical protein
MPELQERPRTQEPVRSTPGHSGHTGGEGDPLFHATANTLASAIGLASVIGAIVGPEGAVAGAAIGAVIGLILSRVRGGDEA